MVCACAVLTGRIAAAAALLLPPPPPCCLAAAHMLTALLLLPGSAWDQVETFTAWDATGMPTAWLFPKPATPKQLAEAKDVSLLGAGQGCAVAELCVGS